MTVPASLSKWAHPPRSNSPRSGTPATGTPGPCITPSTDICVVVVSSMVALPLASSCRDGCPARIRGGPLLTGGPRDKPMGLGALVLNLKFTLRGAQTGGVRRSGASGPCILRAPGRSEDLDRHPFRVGSRLDQVERKIRAGLREQPRPLSEKHRDHDQSHLVDEILLQQPPGQGAAAVYLQLTARLGLQVRNGGCKVAGQDGGARPRRIGEGGRCHELGPGV